MQHNVHDILLDSMAMYADDLVLLTSCPVNMHHAFTTLQSMLRLLGQTFNGAKSKLMVMFGSSRQEKRLQTLFAGSVPVVKRVVFLGIALDTRLLWTTMYKHRLECAVRKYYMVMSHAGRLCMTHILAVRHFLEHALLKGMLYGCELWGMGFVA